MAKKIRQVDFNEALDLMSTDQAVYALTTGAKPVIKQFKYLSISEAKSGDKLVFIVIEDRENGV